MNKKNNKGITLIALVITIIVLLILAGVTVSMLTGENGIITKAKEAKEKTQQAEQEEIYALENVLNSINSSAPSTDGYNENKQVNSPKVTQGMIPVKWNGNNWQVCSQEDNDWYSYSTDKKWANIMLSDGKYKSDTVQVGQIVTDDELGSMYVWIPRYAYTVDNEKQKMNVTFVKGNTNEGVNGETFTTDESVDTKTTKLVHPGFNLGGTALTGIWVAKFEASGTDKNGNAVGNASSTSSEEQYHPDETTIAKSLPNKVSWRHITIGESEKRSMDITTTDKDKFGINYASSHLIKNSEWGAVAYLSYSEYGSVPKINGAGTNNNRLYDLYTGQGPQAANNEGRYEKINDNYNYNTTNGQLASTTGNTTGIYDMNGGARERVAAYLDNGNNNLNNYGKSADEKIKYFENGKLNEEYSSLWDKYEVSEEEKNNKIKIDGETTPLTQSDLSKWETPTENRQAARLRLATANYNNLAKHKGIGVNEVNVTGISFYAPGKSTESNATPWKWYQTVKQALEGTKDYYGKAWDDDFVLIGNSDSLFVLRSGRCDYGDSAGVFYLGFTSGSTNESYGFRSVLVF